MNYSNSSKNSGGWAESSLNTYLNNRIYGAFPIKWKQLIKQVQVKSSIGGGSTATPSTTISRSDCYIFIPALYELSSSRSSEPYYSEVSPASTIDYFASDTSRICYDGSGTAVQYWTRSPNAQYDYAIYTINTSGGLGGYIYPYDSHHVRIMFSI
jgi:hypothetical protein